MATPKNSKKSAGIDHPSSVDDHPSFTETIGREAGAASDALHGAKDQVKAKVAELGTDVQQVAFKQVGALQKNTADGINGFADSIEDAGRVFADRESARTARLMQEAASTLRGLGGSLANKPIADVVEDVRSYGRAHPTILVGGAMLAGVAIGRLMRSAPVSRSGDNAGRGLAATDTPRRFDPELPAAEAAGLAGGEL